MKVLLVFLACIVLTNCQLYNRTDYCLNYDLNFNLQPELLLGDWYPIVVDTGLTYNYDCHKLNIFRSNLGNYSVNILNLLNNNYINFDILKTKRINSFLTTINNVRALNTILDTDYTNYLVGIKCMEYTDGLRYHAFILSRNMTLSDDLILKLENFILQNFSNFEFKKINFNNCS